MAAAAACSGAASSGGVLDVDTAAPSGAATYACTWLAADGAAGERLAATLRADGGVTWSPLAAGADADDTTDAPGYYAAAGYLDLQCNGVAGVDFSGGGVTAAAVEAALGALPRYGVTEVVATLVSSSRATYDAALRVLLEVWQRQDARAAGGAARMAGIHLEGPFLSPAKAGAHAPAHLRVPGRGAAADVLAAAYGDSVRAVLAAGALRLVTLAPELEGAAELTAALAAAGVAVAIGHTTATVEEGEASVRAGATLVTHMFNAMAPFGHRQPGVAGLLATVALRTRPYYSIIADGCHVHATAVALAARAHPAGAVLVTDAMCAMGLPPGPARYGDLAVTVHAGREVGDGTYAGPHVVLAGTTTLAGAVLPLDACVRNFRDYAALPPAAAVAAAAYTPRRVLAPAAPLPASPLAPAAGASDVVLLDRDLRVVATIIGGRVAYRAAR